jgi:hypothetical protein
VYGMKSHVQVICTFLAVMCLLLACSGKVVFAQQNKGYGDVHNLVQATQDDLDRVIFQDPEKDKGRWQARIDSAKRSLSNFDHSLSNNEFNKRGLNAAINRVNDVLKLDALGGRERDALNADLAELRRLRKTGGK